MTEIPRPGLDSQGRLLEEVILGLSPEGRVGVSRCKVRLETAFQREDRLPHMIAIRSSLEVFKLAIHLAGMLKRRFKYHMHGALRSMAHGT